MCGLVAIISKKAFGFIKKDLDIFTQLLYADQLRGSDGTGIFYNSKRGTPIIRTLRAPIPSSKFIPTKEYEGAVVEIFNGANFVVGHNRAATRGKLSTACTHPFRDKHITLVHNGTLNTYKDLATGVEVDSHAICVNMAHKGAKDTLKNIDGAFALIWFNSEEGTLNFCRNFQRPLFIIETLNTYILCSELELGQWICARNGENISSHKTVIPNILYSIDIKNTNIIKEEKVEYKQVASSYYDGDFYQNPKIKSSYNTPIKKTLIHSVGDLIKIKASLIITDTTTYLSAHILIDEDTPKELRTDFKYEDKARVRIYGEIEKLRELIKKKHLIGKIQQTAWRFGEAQYILSDVTEEEETPPEKVTACDFCSSIFEKSKGKRYLIEGYVLCKTCADAMYESTLSTSQNSGC